MRPQFAAALLSFVVATGCAGTTPADGGGDALVEPSNAPEGVDLLVVVKDHELTAIGAQVRFLAGVRSLVSAVAAPICRSDVGGLCACGPDCQGPQVHGATTVHFAVVSTNLGVAGRDVPGNCSSPAIDGDDGVLNPIRFGAAFGSRRANFSGYPSWYLPAGVQCSMPNELPAFLSFDSSQIVPANFDALVCTSALWSGGCRLGEPLEAVTRALIEHDASDTPGNMDPNAGFLRDRSVLAILVVTAEDDISVRDCAHALGQPCSDATDAFDPSSTRWASSDMWLRFQLYQTGSPQDPTWPIDRYIDPADPMAGWLRLRPSHPERIVFGAVSGLPLRGWQQADGTTNWDALLGAPSTDRDNFAARDPGSAIQGTSAEGPISMNPIRDSDPACTGNLVPACYLEGSTYDAASYCLGVSHGQRSDYAPPCRRLIETARRFDEAPLCSGTPCRNGLIDSSCRIDLSNFNERLVQLLRARLAS